MESQFWLDRWKDGTTGWHNGQVHPAIQAHRPSLGGGAILIPLCGASLDVAWIAQHQAAVGAELSPIAAAKLFDEAKLKPSITKVGEHERWTAGQITIWVGDFFRLTVQQTGPCTGVWDRAAMIAIDPSMRTAYRAKLLELAPGGALLLNALVYDQSVQDGPPWAMPPETVAELFPGAEKIDGADVLDDRWRDRGHSYMRAELHHIRLG